MYNTLKRTVCTLAKMMKMLNHPGLTAKFYMECIKDHENSSIDFLLACSTNLFSQKRLVASKGVFEGNCVVQS